MDEISVVRRLFLKRESPRCMGYTEGLRGVMNVYEKIPTTISIERKCDYFVFKTC